VLELVDAVELASEDELLPHAASSNPPIANPVNSRDRER
jgi:hypothetical protein